MPTPARLLTVQHQDTCGPGWLGEWLQAAGVELDVVRPYAGEPLPGLPAYDGLLVLGGAMGCRDDVAAPWLPGVRDRLRQAVAAGMPTLGVCLGGQLLAAACGGTVVRGAVGPEVGAPDVTIRGEAADDPLFARLGPARPAVQWHSDAVTELPPGAVWLAASDAYPHQAFRVGPCAWGVQFHPEATLPIVASWARADRAELAAQGIDVDVAVGAVVERRDDLEAAWRPLAQRFAHVVRSAAPVPAGAD